MAEYIEGDPLANIEAVKKEMFRRATASDLNARIAIEAANAFAHLVEAETLLARFHPLVHFPLSRERHP
jgi:hypothetical protein